MKIAKIAKIGKRPVYDITVKDVHHYALENGVVTHNTAVTYAANQIFVISKSQEKDGTDLVGWKFTINIHKSRYTREKEKLPFTVKFDGGIQKWSGLLDVALESGHVIKPSNGWYSRVDIETGEVEAQKFREKDTHTADFWNQIISQQSFKDWIEKKYKVSTGLMMKDEDLDSAIEEALED